MPTNNKTSLGLNNWAGTDKPKRSDFVQDNTLLDSLLTGHFNDNVRHLTTEDRAFLSQSFVLGSYQGDGKSTQVVSLPFAARLVMVFSLRKPATVYKTADSYTENNFAAVGPQGGMAGLLLSGTSLTVSQTQVAPQPGGVLHNFNSANGAYLYIAFR